MSAPTLAALGLSPALLRAAQAQGFLRPTPVQSQAVPAALEGRDVVACAPTGSGKTAAYAWSVLQALDRMRPAWRRTYALVLVPTRELAVQVGQALHDLSAHMADPIKVVAVFGGVSVNPQMLRLRGGAEVVVATPGRLLDLVERNALQLADVQHLVLDEADRLLDEGFADELSRIRALLPGKRQNLLFSATFSPDVEALAEQFLHEPVRVEVHTQGESAAPDIAQRAIEVDAHRRGPLLRHLIRTENWPRALVFVATRHSAEVLAMKMNREGIPTVVLHGELSQGARHDALQDLQRGAARVLVATDLAARGLHLPDLPVVVNHDLPRSADDYIHRIGRTARAGASGMAVSFIAPEAEAHFRLIEKRQGLRVARERVAGFEPTLGPLSERKRTGEPGSVAPLVATDGGGIKGKRKSKKDKARELAAPKVPPA